MYLAAVSKPTASKKPPPPASSVPGTTNDPVANAQPGQDVNIKEDQATDAFTAVEQDTKNAASPANAPAAEPPAQQPRFGGDFEVRFQHNGARIAYVSSKTQGPYH